MAKELKIVTSDDLGNTLGIDPSNKVNVQVDKITDPKTMEVNKDGKIAIKPSVLAGIDKGTTDLAKKVEANTKAIGNHKHDAADIVSGVLAPERVPNLSADKITSGKLQKDQMPDTVINDITNVKLYVAAGTTSGGNVRVFEPTLPNLSVTPAMLADPPMIAIAALGRNESYRLVVTEDVAKGDTVKGITWYAEFTVDALGKVSEIFEWGGTVTKKDVYLPRLHFTRSKAVDGSDVVVSVSAPFKLLSDKATYSSTNYAFEVVSDNSNSAVRPTSLGVNWNDATAVPGAVDSEILEFTFEPKTQEAKLPEIPKTFWKEGTEVLVNQDGELKRLQVNDNFFQEIGVGIVVSKSRPNIADGENTEVVITVSNISKVDSTKINLDVALPDITVAEYIVSNLRYERQDNIESVTGDIENGFVINKLKQSSSFTIKFDFEPKVLKTYLIGVSIAMEGASKDLPDNNHSSVTVFTRDFSEVDSDAEQDSNYVATAECPLIEAYYVDSGGTEHKLVTCVDLSLNVLPKNYGKFVNVINTGKGLPGVKLKLKGVSSVVCCAGNSITALPVSSYPHPNYKEQLSGMLPNSIPHSWAKLYESSYTTGAYANANYRYNRANRDSNTYRFFEDYSRNGYSSGSGSSSSSSSSSYSSSSSNFTDGYSSSSSYSSANNYEYKHTAAIGSVSQTVWNNYPASQTFSPSTGLVVNGWALFANFPNYIYRNEKWSQDLSQMPFNNYPLGYFNSTTQEYTFKPKSYFKEDLFNVGVCLWVRPSGKNCPWQSILLVGTSDNAYTQKPSLDIPFFAEHISGAETYKLTYDVSAGFLPNRYASFVYNEKHAPLFKASQFTLTYRDQAKWVHDVGRAKPTDLDCYINRFTKNISTSLIPKSKQNSQNLYGSPDFRTWNFTQLSLYNSPQRLSVANATKTLVTIPHGTVCEFNLKVALNSTDKVDFSYSMSGALSIEFVDDTTLKITTTAELSTSDYFHKGNIEIRVE